MIKVDSVPRFLMVIDKVSRLFANPVQFFQQCLLLQMYGFAFISMATLMEWTGREEILFLQLRRQPLGAIFGILFYCTFVSNTYIAPV